MFWFATFFNIMVTSMRELNPREVMVMPEGNLENNKRILIMNDRSSLIERAERHSDLTPIETIGRDNRTQRNYIPEAGLAYTNGSFRSAIFCCACEIDQCFRFEYLMAPGTKYEDLLQKNPDKQVELGRVINICETKKIERLKPFVEKAKLLNSVRNAVAVHPKIH
jgi:hypothetical protein